MSPPLSNVCFLPVSLTSECPEQSESSYVDNSESKNRFPFSSLSSRSLRILKGNESLRLLGLRVH